MSRLDELWDELLADAELDSPANAVKRWRPAIEGAVIDQTRRWEAIVERWNALADKMIEAERNSDDSLSGDASRSVTLDL